MKKLLSIATVMIVATAIAGFALAGTFEKSGSLKNGTTSYTVKLNHPKKIILYPEAHRSELRTALFAQGEPPSVHSVVPLLHPLLAICCGIFLLGRMFVTLP